MKQKHRVPLFVEPLEDRWVPATVRLLSTGLFVSNPLIVNGSTSITVTATGTNQFKVTDNGQSLGTYNTAGNVYITGSNAKDTIKFDLNGNTYAGNLYVNSLNGNDTINVVNGGAAITSLAGNVNILSGLGNDSVNLSTTGGGGANGIIFGGNVLVANTLGGVDTLNVGNGASSTTVGGDVTVVGFSNVAIGAGKQDFIGGNLSVTSQNINTGVAVTLGTSAGVGTLVGKNLTVNTGAGNDSVLLNGVAGATTHTNVFGNVSLNLGSGNNLFSTAGGAGTLVNGNLTYQGGSGNDTVQTLANTPAIISNWLVVQGNAQFNFGDGNVNFLTAAGGSTGGDIQTFGDLRVSAGNGNDSITLGTPGLIDSKVSQANGNLFVTLGNGTDQTSINGFVGGTFNYRSGNGNDTLTLGNVTAVAPTASTLNYNSYVQFGNGDDSFVLGTTGLISGTYDGGGRITMNTFVQNNAVLTPNFTLSNFP